MPARAASPAIPAWPLALAVALSAASFGLAAVAQPQPSPVKRAAEAAGPSWQSLSGQQRAALAPLQNDWASIDAPRKAKWLDIAARYQKLPASEQRRLQTRMSEWSRMSPSERGRARLHFQEVKQLPHEERQDRWQAYQALPEAQRRALATRAAGTNGARPSSSSAKPPPQASTKHNIVANPSLSARPGRTVAPTVVQAAPGATTSLVTRQAAPPTHQQPGMPKIAATPGFVDRKTLLPKRGPQSAGVRPASSTPGKQP